MSQPLRQAVVAGRTLPPMSPDSATTLGHVLADLRRRLDMDVALVSRFVDGRRVIELVDSEEALPFAPGDSDPVDQTYCRLIVDGDLPELIRDTSKNELAMTAAATDELRIRSHLGVPVVLEDGSVYGTLCAYSHRVRPDLMEQAGTVMGLVADTVARAIGAERLAHEATTAASERIRDLIAHGRLEMAYQPVVDLVSGRTVGVEALARFPASTGSAADWFSEATAVGVGNDLELACVRLVRDQVPDLPADLAVHVNLTPKALLDPAAVGLLRQLPLRRTVLELAEHQILGARPVLQAVLDPLRAAGMRLAIDDAGAGVTSMRHALLLQPDLLKLDISLVRGIDVDTATRSLCQALTGFAHATGALIVAEGVETPAEAAAVRSLGVDLAQGYLFARPAPARSLQEVPPPHVFGTALPDRAGQIEAVLAGLRGHASPATMAAALNAQGLLAPTGRRWHAASVSKQLLA